VFNKLTYLLNYLFYAHCDYWRTLKTTITAAAAAEAVVVSGGVRNFHLGAIDQGVRTFTGGVPDGSLVDKVPRG